MNEKYLMRHTKKMFTFHRIALIERSLSNNLIALQKLYSSGNYFQQGSNPYSIFFWIK